MWKVAFIRLIIKIIDFINNLCEFYDETSANLASRQKHEQLSNMMKRTKHIAKGLLACFAFLALLMAPLQVDAKKGTNNGNGNGNGNSGGSTSDDSSDDSSSGTTATGSGGTGSLVLGAPGVGLDFLVLNKTPFAQTSDIGRYYKFVFTGIEVQSDADGVAGSYTYSNHMWDTKQKSNNGHGNNCDGVDSSNPGNGHGGPNGQDDPSGDVDDECGHNADDDNDGTPNHSDPDYNGAKYVYGTWSMWARVNDQQIGNLTYTSSELEALSPVLRKYFTTPVVFEEQNITLEWHGTGNSSDPNGHFYILGSAIKEPPVPRGELQINQTYYEDGATPNYGWSIDRE